MNGMAAFTIILVCTLWHGTFLLMSFIFLREAIKKNYEILDSAKKRGEIAKKPNFLSNLSMDM